MSKTPCPLTGKHKWAFIKNGTVTKASFGIGGTSMRFSLRGFYGCPCGASRVGQPHHDAPGADLRDHLAKATA